jgi:hypothetical protein
MGVVASVFGYAADLQLCNPLNVACHHAAPLMQFTLASGLPGFEKVGENAAKALFGAEGYGAKVGIFILFQKAVMLLFLFFAGLALRNLFKMK